MGPSGHALHAATLLDTTPQAFSGSTPMRAFGSLRARLASRDAGSEFFRPQERVNQVGQQGHSHQAGDPIVKRHIIAPLQLLADQRERHAGDEKNDRNGDVEHIEHR